MAKPWIDIGMVGDKELQRALNRISRDTQEKFVQQSLRKGAKPILASAITGVPVRTGRLKTSLKIRTRKRKRKGILGVQVQTGTRAELGIAADAPGYYPIAVEYGTKHMAADPYLRPALDTNRDKALGIIGRELWNRIRGVQ